ncbi:MAG TPA: hypothetical protein VNK52_06490 [Hyphomicrobiaceae bacterium]|nr:hypothetical protein [Hyphomicrobiaceae bacterium]
MDQIVRVAQSPWQSWPLWKQLLLVLIAAGVIWALLRVARELREAGEKVLAAFAALLGVLVRTLPSIAVAGLVALGGLWLLNNFDPSAVRLPGRTEHTSR